MVEIVSEIFSEPIHGLLKYHETRIEQCRVAPHFALDARLDFGGFPLGQTRGIHVGVKSNSVV